MLAKCSNRQTCFDACESSSMIMNRLFQYHGETTKKTTKIIVHKNVMTRLRTKVKRSVTHETAVFCMLFSDTVGYYKKN
jgi:hypothetical protein